MIILRLLNWSDKSLAGIEHAIAISADFAASKIGENIETIVECR